jgi:hypothetical protein
MVEETKPITTTTFAKPDRTIEFGGNAQDAEQNQDDQQKISVRALRTFHENPSLKGNVLHPGDEFECPRVRAAELRANGLIEYVNEGDEKTIHGEIGAKATRERVERQTEASKLPEQHKTTPLRNPKLELGTVDESAKPDKYGKK